MKKLEFFMDMIPPTVTAQERQVTVKNGKPVFYEKPELKNAREKLMAHLNAYKPKELYDGPVELVVKWCFLHPELKGKYAWRSTKPDTDNLEKLLKDCMTKVGYWKDDALVCREIVEKFWVKEKPGIFIRISGLDGGERV